VCRPLQPSKATHDLRNSSSSQKYSSDQQISSPSLYVPAGSAFLQRCWRQEQEQGSAVAPGQHANIQCPCLGSPGPVSALIAAATAVWVDSCSQVTQSALPSPGGPGWGSSSKPAGNIMTAAAGSSYNIAASAVARNMVTGGPGAGTSFSSLHQQPAGAAAAIAAVGSNNTRARRVSGGCQPSVGLSGAGSDGRWNKDPWAGGARMLAH
jgi:hypothetical protein